MIYLATTQETNEIKEMIKAWYFADNWMRGVWRGGATGLRSDLRSRGREVRLPVAMRLRNDSGQVAAGKVTVGLAWHQLCVTDFSVLTTYGLKIVYEMTNFYRATSC